ncbi:reverse transcriptase domain-containing protein [Tanacetum coccineum]
MGNVLIPRNEVKGVTTRGGKMTSEATPSKEVNETGINKNEPPRFEQDVQEKPHDDGVKNKSSSIPERATHPLVKPQQTSIPFPNWLRKEKEEAQQWKFLENLKQLYINILFIEALVQIPKYAKYLKSLLTNKSILEEACTVIMNERCLVVLLNKLPSKEKDPGSFTIPCQVSYLQINNALADLGASISLMPYTMYENLGLGELKPTRISLELADRPPTKDDECYGIDDLDDTINIETQELLENDQLNSFLLKDLEKSINRSDLESCNSIGDKFFNNSDVEMSIRHIDPVNTLHSKAQEPEGTDRVKNEHVYSASANEIDEKKPKLKDLASHLEYAYLHGNKSFLIIISSKLSEDEKISLLQVLEKRKGAIAWKMSDIKGIIQDVVKNEIVKLLDSGLIYPISDSSWVSPIHVVPKKGGLTVVLNDNNELIPSRTVTGWRVCIDYRKVNDTARKDHFPLLFIDQMLERLSGNEYYCFLDGFLGFFQIPIASEDQARTMFTCPYGTFAYRRMSFGLCNTPATFQRYMMAIFHDMVEDFMEVFMDDFLVFGNSFNCCLANLDKMLARCEEINLVLNWEKYHFMVKEGIVKQDAKPRLIRWVLLLQEFNIEIKDKNEAENLAAYHLSRLENPHIEVLTEREITDEFLDEHLMVLRSEFKDDEPCWNQVPPSPSLKILEIKQLAIKQGDKYGFVIRPCLVGITFESVRIDL